MEQITMRDILYAVLTVVLPLMLRYAYQLLAMKIAESKHADAVDAVYTAVDYVMQKFVDSLKQSGCFDEEAQRKAYLKAKDAALEIMEDSTRKWLEKTQVNLDAWLEVQIEAAVKAAKGSAAK